MQDDPLFKRILIALLAQEYHRVLAVNADHMRRWRAKNPERSRQIVKESAKRHPERVERCKKAYLERNRAVLGERKRVWRKAHKAEIAARRKAYCAKYPERVAARHKEYYKENTEKIRVKQQARWRAMTPEQRDAYRAYQNDWVKNRCKTDPVFRMMRSFRCRLSIFLTRPYRNSGMNELIGCTGQEFRAHIESLWEPWMNWDNFGRGDGKWVVDHVAALSRFDLTNTEQLHKAWHFTNLKPLEWRANLIKNAKLLAPVAAPCEPAAVTSST